MHVFVVLDTPLCLFGGRMNLNFVHTEHYPLLASMIINQ